MSQAKSGDTVKIHYTGTLDDGTEFDSSAGREPLEFEVGGGQVIPGFDNAVEGMAVGDKKSVKIEAGDAYGERHEQLVQQVPRSALPDDLTPEEGMALQSQAPDGQVMMLMVTAVGAGKALSFDIELVSIGGDVGIIIPGQ
jgi:peptidylprolyl isomerase